MADGLNYWHDIYVAVDYTDVFKSIVLFEVLIAIVPILIAIASLVLIIFKFQETEC